MKNLSELLRELADHAEKAENKAEAAEKETSEKVHAILDASKADAKARQDEFKANVAKKKAASASDWEKVQADHKQRVEKIKSNIAAQKDAVSRKARVKWRAFIKAQKKRDAYLKPGDVVRCMIKSADRRIDLGEQLLRVRCARTPHNQDHGRPGVTHISGGTS